MTSSRGTVRRRCAAAAALPLLAFGAGCAARAAGTAPRAIPSFTAVAAERRVALESAGLRAETVAGAAGPLRVFVGGRGPTVVLVHGTGVHAGDWYRVVPALAARYRLLVPDLPGHGESAAAEGPIAVADLAAALGAVIEAKGGGGRVTLVGNSLGGWVSLLYAAGHPERVERVVGISSSGIFARLAVPLRPQDREEARKLALAIRSAWAPAATDAELDAMVAGIAAGPAARLLAGLRAEDFLEGKATAIGVPVDLVWGEEDGVLPPDYGRRLAALLPDARFHPLPRCGHMPQVWCPESLLPLLFELLAAPAARDGAVRH
jgi:pimeloyl-ACP methyl ester carboxylesterase